jgi:hypothetical protein
MRERKGFILEKAGKLYVRISYTDRLGKRRELMRRAQPSAFSPTPRQSISKSRVTNPAPCLWLLCIGLLATAGPVPTPLFVMLDQAVKNLLRRHALMPKDVDERVADAERFAGVDLGIRDADWPLHKIRVVRHGETQAVVSAADEEIALHVSFFPLFAGDCLQLRNRLACAANSTRGNSRCEEKSRAGRLIPGGFVTQIARSVLAASSPSARWAFC